MYKYQYNLGVTISAFLEVIFLKVFFFFFAEKYKHLNNEKCRWKLDFIIPKQRNNVYECNSSTSTVEVASHIWF